MSKESCQHYEKYNRVQQLILGDGLPVEDKEAIRHVLGMLNLMADDIASREGSTISQVVESIARIVESCQEAPWISKEREDD